MNGQVEDVESADNTFREKHQISADRPQAGLSLTPETEQDQNEAKKTGASDDVGFNVDGVNFDAVTADNCDDPEGPTGTLVAEDFEDFIPEDYLDLPRPDEGRLPADGEEFQGDLFSAHLSEKASALSPRSLKRPRDPGEDDAAARSDVQGDSLSPTRNLVFRARLICWLQM